MKRFLIMCVVLVGLSVPQLAYGPSNDGFVSKDKMQERHQKHHKQLKKKLKLSESQEAAFDALHAQLKGKMKKLREMGKPFHDNVKAEMEKDEPDFELIPH